MFKNSVGHGQTKISFSFFIIFLKSLSLAKMLRVLLGYLLVFPSTRVVMDATLAQIFFKPEKNLEFFRLKKMCHRWLSW